MPSSPRDLRQVVLVAGQGGGDRRALGLLEGAPLPGRHRRGWDPAPARSARSARPAAAGDPGRSRRRWSPPRRGGSRSATRGRFLASGRPGGRPGPRAPGAAGGRARRRTGPRRPRPGSVRHRRGPAAAAARARTPPGDRTDLRGSARPAPRRRDRGGWRRSPGCRPRARWRAADAVEPALLQHPQELALERRRQLGHLVEEQGPGVGLLEPPRGARAGAGERAALVTEQLGLVQRLRDRGAVDGDEGPIAGGRCDRGSRGRPAPCPSRSRRGMSSVISVGATCSSSRMRARIGAEVPIRPWYPGGAVGAAPRVGPARRAAASATVRMSVSRSIGLTR
jgi:hypothetical protein